MKAAAEGPYSHEEIVRRRGGDPEKCVVMTGRWPYDCDAMRKHPTATVRVCHTHECWWFEPLKEEGP